MEEYRKMYPNAKLESEKTSSLRGKRTGEALRGRKLPDDVKRKISEGVKRKFREDPVAKEKAVRALLENNPMKDPNKREVLAKRISERMKKNNPMKNPEVVEKVFEKRKGFRHTKEARLKISMSNKGRKAPKSVVESARRRMLLNNPMKDPKTVEKVRNKMRGRFKNKTYEELYGEEVARWMREIRRIKMTTNNPMKRPEARRKVSLKRKELLRERKLKLPMKKTSIEQKVEKILKDIDLDFVYNDGSIVVCGKIPDFVHVSRKMIIEVFGCYWHACECCFPNLDKEHSDEVRKSDKERLERFIRSGWKVLVIWEHELSDVSRVREKIERWYYE